MEMDGLIEPVKQSLVASQTSGRMMALHVKAGDWVKAGQLLATIDDRETQTGVQRSQAQLAQSDFELNNAQMNLTRSRDLKLKGFISQAALESVELQVKAAQAARVQATAEARQSSLTHDFTRVSAPYDGFISETLAQVGDLAVPGKPLLHLYSPNAYRAVVYVGVSRLPSIRAATQIEVQSASDNGSGWVKPIAQQILPAADPISQTMEWRLDLANTSGLTWVPGQQVRVRFSGLAAQRMMVPSSAILHRGEITAVYVSASSGFILRIVRLGAMQASGEVEVVAGLNVNDLVALDPVQAGMLGAQALLRTSNTRPVAPSVAPH
jgi:RND family efflux transporter MFP subunit